MKSILATIAAFFISIFGFGGHQAHTTNDVQNQPAAAVVSLGSDSFAPFATSSVATTTPPTPTEGIGTTPSTSSGQASIVNQYITQPVIERTVQTVGALPSDYVTEGELSGRLADLSNVFARTVFGSTYPAPATSYASGGIMSTVALMGRIDNLSGTTLSDITVDGVSGLTDSDIPDSITASNYLPLSGGMLTFASSTLFSAFNGAYFGATATSSFDSAGALTLATPLLVSSGGTGLSSINPGLILFGGSSSALATSSSLFWDNTNNRLGIGTSSPQSFVQINPVGTTTSASADGVLLRVAGMIDGNRGIVFSSQMTGNTKSH